MPIFFQNVIIITIIDRASIEIRIKFNLFFKNCIITRGASLRLFCYPGNRFLIRSVNRVTVHNSEICKKGPKQK